ncbi:tetratricopeptide repeat protein [Aetokthonos hydrillicola Thurmond2011]|jgi:tetratricopeptide (TPR) repeat protein|uniref:Tetratricopeptide repeat protein n=1 Tax=Aetokthonos hydrillicola Thurmond2011 TaxID=2712845 RepID=A0AAP5M8Y8_9CYAN|nr:tetratricopeptide repeat protein [Aetokthonos hydrillicola]MBO3457501.1 tetratricopeptide repeat protein [Aetokthonos hydrillicola CCALA 1050]MBW4585976.1 tetratricopeptide repeat protein [Aetokthonos hydrillicola CCALA 1050]MDR9893794.1 tetratricopeptide repeat protein [Aetokthonos hydrillicola Thurmond2011]
MDWITLLRSLQSDFTKRLTSGYLLHCETEGQYSELTVISGERLKALREFCWQMAEKYKRTSPVRDVFINNLKGKLGEEVVKERLADLITEVDYERRFGGDGKIDFTLTYDSSVGISVKSRYGSTDKVRWSINSEEVEKNTVVACILIQEEVSEAQPEYHLFFAGFLPTQMIKLRTGHIAFGIDQLLYGGGLRCYLEQLQSPGEDNSYRQKPPIYQYNLRQEPIYKPPKNQVIKPGFSPPQEDNSYRYQNADLNLLYIKLGDECFDKGQYEAAITTYNEALQVKPKDATTYYKRGDARYHIRDYEGAIADFLEAIAINPHYGKAYNKSGNARYQLGDYEGAIEDYTQAIKINPNDALAYRNRADARFHIRDNQGAIEDYTQAIKINPYLLEDKHELNQVIPIYQNNNADDKNGNVLSEIEQYKRAIEVFTQVIEISPNDADAYKNRGNARSDLGDYEGAIEDYTQAIKINPNNADAYYNRGNALSDLEDYQKAIEDYTQAIKINPNDADAYYERGNARCEVGDKQGAIEDFYKATELYRKDGKLVEHKNVREKILDLELEESLDILNF